MLILMAIISCPKKYCPFSFQETTFREFTKSQSWSTLGCKHLAKEVSKENIEEVFGKFVKFKTTNAWLHVDTKKDLLHLCSHIYGM
jgi:hypothetical protein